MKEKTPEALRGVFDRAIKLVDTYTPVTDCNPTPGGGNVRITAVAVLVAARALVEALIEHDKESSDAK